MTLERRRGEALWSQIAGQLAQDISDGLHPVGGRLPTEAQLAEQYGVNRHTIRRALDELANARIIRTEHGRGSFVAEDVLDYRIGKRPRFSEWVRSHNRTPMGEILQLNTCVLSELPEAEPAAAALGLDAADEVVLLERLGLADARPVALSRHIFPAKRYPGLLAALQGQTSITAALESVGVADYTRRWTRVCARMPDLREARLLRMARTDALLACETLNTTEAGVTVEFGATCYPAPRVQLVFEP
ncbi:MAG: phosphonate metabolism transcriptional regulator PhnF [Rhodospirillales bacterium 20-64-7]|nr:MAG: phosphonate metabolism transcriptional regulator PhnF [Rhodospirillales bacterium 20-64-7]